ncbi:hypothetical protein A1O3_10026 [Capronia epimyces CBS 606.96]|uniref:PH domain-containing protein n=1 Tax=Capronia epimyces CBS 606.96 TaxID=1182542 RepID=W9XBD7_9EURO|nr:uncharacterized protein A1O3_10026 [Capronia epimyces CBS 606.96]EXJ77797.1 hypothetical protein A1O3_10026 [Capronia epimyces CBS 606.96]
MSVEAPKSVEETPVAETSKPLPEQPEALTAPVETSAAPTETTEAALAADATTTEEPVAPATEEVKKDETPAAPVPASEGVLGYKEPTLFKKFFFTKHYFWFSEEPSTPESLATFLRSEKADAKHSTAAWARETGKGLLFFAKRVEDKATPVGIINLADASSVTKEGYNLFSFKAGSHQHRFEATKADERASWIVAIEKAIEEAKGLKEEIIGRESYKKNVEEYSKPPVIAPAAAAKTPRSKSKEPKKSLEVNAAATAAAATTPAADNSSTSANSAEETPKAKKERSQSRKRGSIFGTLLGKKEELAEKKEEKAEAKKEVKEEQETEAEEKKEEAKADEEPSKAVEAAEASAVAAAAAPVAAVATDKKEDKEEEAPTDKKAKRGSVFGNFFKHRVTSPTSEKTENEATTSSDVPPVSETAPKLEEPIENKPINTADVTAPVDAETSAAPAEEPAKDATPVAAEASSTPKTEKKGGFIGFIKKTEAKLEGKKEHKEEAKEETAAEEIAKDPVAAASTQPTETAVTDSAAETKEERPARDNKRRTSLFFNKKRTEATDGEDATAEQKREKSPLPGKLIGNLVRRASKAVKSEGPKDKPAEPVTETATTAPSAHEATTVSETPAPVAEASEPSQITGDVVPEDLVSKPEPATTSSTAPEVKASA